MGVVHFVQEDKPMTDLRLVRCRHWATCRATGCPHQCPHHENYDEQLQAWCSEVGRVCRDTGYGGEWVRCLPVEE